MVDRSSQRTPPITCDTTSDVLRVLTCRLATHLHWTGYSEQHRRLSRV